MLKNHNTLILLGLVLLLLGLFGSCGKPAGESSKPTSLSTQKTITTPTGIVMVLIPAGEFKMGNENGEADEKPVHTVKLAAFYMDQYEVTQKSFESLMGRNPSKSKSPDKPVEQLSWFAAVKYCNARSMKEGLTVCYQLEPLQCNFKANGYRLPTEAEWEYACRAGTNSIYSFGNDPTALSQYAWFKNNADKTTHPVGKKSANPWGIFDLHGNVWEWCNDFYDESYYQKSGNENPIGPDSGQACVLRGGGWNSTEESCTSSIRYNEAPGLADVCFGYDAYGFRCVKKLE